MYLGILYLEFQHPLSTLWFSEPTSEFNRFVSSHVLVRIIHPTQPCAVNGFPDRRNPRSSSPTMDSQITLVGDTSLPDRAASTVFNFTRDSLLNAKLHLRGSERATYVISTNSRATCTEVRKYIPGGAAQMVLSVSIERSELFPNKVTLEGYPPIKINKWIINK